MSPELCSGCESHTEYDSERESLIRIANYMQNSARGSERPENCPVDSFQRRAGGTPGREAK